MKAPIYFKWPNKVWIISDTHFGDGGILKFERTQFSSIEEHDNFIIESINRTVHPGETIVFLGDMGAHTWSDSIKKIRTDVYKVLIMGNHDRFARAKYEELFDEVYNGPLFINKFIVLSHEPIPVSEHFLNIHGHLHNSYIDDDHHLNLSAHMCNYKPYELDRAYEMTATYPRIRARFLDEWYADKYVFTDGMKRRDVYMYRDTGHIIPKSVLDEVMKRFINPNGDVDNIYDTRKYFFFISIASKSIRFYETDGIEGILQKINDKYSEVGDLDVSLWDS